MLGMGLGKQLEIDTMQEIKVETHRWNATTRKTELSSSAVKAHIYGDWAAHKALDGAKGCSVTHVPTGKRAGFPKTIREAKALAKHYSECNYPDAVFEFGVIPAHEWVLAASKARLSFCSIAVLS